MAAREPERYRAVSRPASLLLAAWLLLALAASAPAAEPVDLIGSWYVLIHYRDSLSANPDSDRWDDRIWQFKKKGSRLQWVEYPIVVFSKQEGRFGRVGRNPRARILQAWEPDAAQRAEIELGLQVNQRGSKTKSLRGSPAKGYKSMNTQRSVSALTVGYQETWSIDDPATLPIFTRDDALGTEMALATQDDSVASGRTRYKTLEVGSDGVLRGSFARDENRRGSFQMIPAGTPRGLESDGRTPNEKASQRIQQSIQAAERDQAYSSFLSELGNDRLRELRATIGEDRLTEIWSKYERRIIDGDTSARAELESELRAAVAEEESK